MQLMSSDAALRSTKVGPSKAKAPGSLSTVCPHCGEKGIFTLNNHQDDAQRMAVAADAKCPGCDKAASGQKRTSDWSTRERC